MALLTKSAILKAQDFKTTDVDVPEWGGTVRLRTMSGTERDEFEQLCMQASKNNSFAGMRARLVSLTAVDETGERLFNDKEVEALGNKSSKALQRLFDSAQKLNGITDDEVEELEGNS